MYILRQETQNTVALLVKGCFQTTLMKIMWFRKTNG